MSHNPEYDTIVSYSGLSIHIGALPKPKRYTIGMSCYHSSWSYWMFARKLPQRMPHTISDESFETTKRQSKAALCKKNRLSLDTVP